MFHLAFDSTLLQEVELDDLAKRGIQLAPKFQQSLIDDLQSNTMRYRLSSEDAIYRLEEISANPIFRVTTTLPISLESAFTLARKISFRPPLCIWLRGSVYTENYPYDYLNVRR